MNEQRVLSLDVLRGISVSGFVLGLGLLVLGLHGVPAVPGSQAGFSGALSGAAAVPGGWGASAVVIEWAAREHARPVQRGAAMRTSPGPGAAIMRTSSSAATISSDAGRWEKAPAGTA